MLRIIFLLRFLCFIAVVYLAMHVIVIRLSRKPGSKLLWFFSVLTRPLLRPVKWLAPATAANRLPSTALFFYVLLWLVFVVLDEVFAG